MRLILLILTAIVVMTLTAGYLAMVDVFDPIGFKGIFAATMGLMFFGTGLLWVLYTERDKLAETMKNELRIHPVSGLINSQVFLKQMSEDLNAARRQKNPYGLLIVGLDSFREVNNRMGHSGGDTVLKHVAERITYGVADKGLTGHYSGDMFIVGMNNARPETMQRLAETLQELLISAPYRTKGVSASLSVSISCVMAPPNDYDPEVMLLNLLNRLHLAKSRGGNRIVMSDS